MKIILIGGSSHAGKSTVARALADRLGADQLGWDCISTDSLARHPGRPWKTPPERVPPHVADHYGSLSTEELLADVLRHYESLWPRIRELIQQRASDETPGGLVLEGSAIWPGYAKTLDMDGVHAIWLTASHETFRARILAESGFEKKDASAQLLITKFLERTLLFDTQLMEMIKKARLPVLNVDDDRSVDALCARVLEAN